VTGAPSAPVDSLLTNVVEASRIVDIASRLRGEYVRAAVEAGVTWRHLADHLNAAGIKATASGLHRKYGRG
jgi:hypothetical protein